MVKNPPANAGDMALIPGVGRSHMAWGSQAHEPPRHDEDLREPLVRCQGSQDSMRVARGSASWLSCHGRGLGPRDASKKDSRGLSRGAACVWNPRVFADDARGWQCPFVLWQEEKWTTEDDMAGWHH